MLIFNILDLFHNFTGQNYENSGISRTLLNFSAVM